MEYEVGENTSTTVSFSFGPNRETKWFVNATDVELRNLLDWHNPDIDRSQLLAACHNRWPCGYWYEITPRKDGLDGPYWASMV